MSRTIVGYNPITLLPCYSDDPPRQTHCEDCGKRDMIFYNEQMNVRLTKSICFECWNRWDKEEAES